MEEKRKRRVMEVFDNMQKEAAMKHVIEFYKSKGLYDANLKMLEGFLLEQKGVTFLLSDVKKLEENRKLVREKQRNQFWSTQITWDNWTVHVVRHCSQWHDINNSGVFMCKYLEYWARGERLPFDGNNAGAARLIFSYEVQNRRLADETILEKLKQIVLQGVSGPRIMDSISASKTAFQGNAKILLKLAQATHLQSDHKNESEESEKADFSYQKPEWLDRFFRRTFFDPCSEHPIRRNELNKYCIDCDASLCQYCLSLTSHANHRLLKIYRHVYKDVVPLDEIDRHMDCSKIQPYRCNRQLVIALTPLPHTGSKTNEEATCQTCKRKLIEYDIYSYCSISCKVEAFSKKNNGSVPPFLSLAQPVPKAEPELKPKMPTRKRKGIPHRSPLF